jgi:hypothetical protein
MVTHPQVQALIAAAGLWGSRPLQRHNDASHALYKLSTLADMGLHASDQGLPEVVEQVMARQGLEGAFQTLLDIPTHFGGSGEGAWSWMACDAPTLLYSLLVLGLGSEPQVQRAVEHVAGLVHENGWRCAAAPELGKFRGPGRKDDLCPIANVYALKALSLVPELMDSAATGAGVETLLQHWEARGKRNRFTASSMYQAWKGWSFADKKNPSPWLTFLCLRLLKRSAVYPPV